MSSSNPTGLFGVVFWCIALAALLLWGLVHTGHLDPSFWAVPY
jgi:hypothetical protein